MTARTLVHVAVLTVAIAALASTDARSEDVSDESEESRKGRPVARWLVLGPVADPPPAFHDAPERGVDAMARLTAPVFHDRPWFPAEGAAERALPSGRETWRSVSADAAGLVVLDGSVGHASVWLASYVETDRFRSLAVEVSGSGPRGVWLDGTLVAKGKGKKVSGKLKLEPGKHLVVVRSMHVPSNPSDDTEADAESGSDAEQEDGERSAWSTGLRLLGDDSDLEGVAWNLSPVRRMGVDDVLAPSSVTSLAVSPDGALAALAFRRIVPGTDKAERWVEVRSTEDGSIAMSFRGAPGAASVRFAPTGRRLSYVTNGVEAKTRTLWVTDLDSGVTRPILENVEDWAGYAWSPAGDAVAYVVRQEPEDDKTGIKRFRTLLDRQAGHRTKSYLYLATVPEGTRRRLTAGPYSTSLGGFSPDGSKLVFTRSVEDLEARPFTTTEVWELDLSTFEAKRLFEGPWINGVQYSPDGRSLLVRGGPSAFDRAGSALSDDVVPNDYDGQLYTWSFDDGSVRPRTLDFDPAVLAAAWPAGARGSADTPIVLRAEDRDYVRVYRLNPATGDIAPIEVPSMEAVSGLAVARAGNVAVVSGSGVWAPHHVAVVDLATDESRVLVRPSTDWFEEVEIGEARAFSFTSSEGRTIDGRFYLPVGFDPERRYPMIVYYYGGTSPVSRSFAGRYPKEYWASRGYVVYVPQPSGATGYGQAFSAAHVNDWGATTVDEIIEGTRAFLEAHAFVDPERLGCLGASYGGFVTMKLLTETDMFSAAVSHAGISALSSYWGEGYWGYLYSAVATADAYPWNRRDVYVEQSPLFHADEIRTPLLLTHGDKDPNVPPGESDQLFVALRLLGREVEYLSVGGQEHWVLDHAKRSRWTRSIVAWFDRYLKDRPEWWEHLYPPAGSEKDDTRSEGDGDGDGGDARGRR